MHLLSVPLRNEPWADGIGKWRAALSIHHPYRGDAGSCSAMGTNNTGLWLRWMYKGALKEPQNCMPYGKEWKPPLQRLPYHSRDGACLVMGWWATVLGGNCSFCGCPSAAWPALALSQGSSPTVREPVLVRNVGHDPQDWVCFTIHLSVTDKEQGKCSRASSLQLPQANMEQEPKERGRKQCQAIFYAAQSFLSP